MAHLTHTPSSPQPNAHPDPTRPGSAHLRVVRHIPDPMPQTTQAVTPPAPARVRPPAQAAQLIVRMSGPERQAVHAAAGKAGLSTTAFLLDLARRACPHVAAAGRTVQARRKGAPTLGDARHRKTRTRDQSPLV